MLAFVFESSWAKKPVIVVYLRDEDEFLLAVELLASPMTSKLKTDSKNKAGLAGMVSD